MDFIQVILGRYLIELLGASVRYIYENSIILFTNKDFISFSKFWNPKMSKEKKLENEASNRIAGLIFFVIFFLILVSFLV
jgi:nitric oxide reductase large subunit